MPNSKQKGSRGERQICQALNERFAHLPIELGRFSRTVGSGNRFGQQVILGSAAIQTYAGDITTPTGFRFCLEVKTGYPKLDLSTLKPNALLDSFLEQADNDAKKCDRIPTLIVKQDRRDAIAFVPSILAPRLWPSLRYRDFTGLLLSVWLKEPDEYFFEETQ